MGDKISQLTSATSLDGTESVPVVQSGTTKKAAAALFKTTNAGDLATGTVAVGRLPVGSTLSPGVLQLGTTSGTACDGADSRLSNSRTPSGSASGDLTGTYPSPSLAESGVNAGIYGSATSVPQITVDAKGRITNAASAAIPLPQPSDATPSALGIANPGALAAYSRADHIHAAPSTTLTGDATGTGTGTVPVTLANTGVTQGTYGSGTTVPQITVDAKGRVLAVNTVPFVSSAGGTVTSVDASGGSTGLTFSGGPITTSGIVTLAGTLNIENGGTAATTAVQALTNLGGVPLSTKGIANGVASLDGTGKVPVAQSQTASAIGGVASSSVGVANGVAALDSGGRVPTSQSPTLTTLGGVPYSSVGVANGIAQLDGTGLLVASQVPNITTAQVTDFAAAAAAVGPVSSVAGKTGDVTLTTSDIAGYASGVFTGGVLTSKLTTAASTTTSAMLNLAPGAIPLSPINGDMWMTTSTVNFFVNNSTLSLSPSYSIDYLVVAGGGAGGSSQGGGGGGGGLISGSTTVLSGSSYTITIGSGGAGNAVANSAGSNGADSIFGVIAQAIGGGGGGGGNRAGTLAIVGVAGGSGGGGAGSAVSSRAGGSATSGQGFAGGTGSIDDTSTAELGGGGGGAGAIGGNFSITANGSGGNGGAGVNWLSLGTFYSGGGGGGVRSDATSAGTGGTGGGGNGASGTTAGSAGTSNTGGGGGGGGGQASTSNLGAGGNGGSGVVVIRYLGIQKANGGTITSNGGYTYHTFTTSGTFAA